MTKTTPSRGRVQFTHIKETSKKKKGKITLIRRIRHSQKKIWLSGLSLGILWLLTTNKKQEKRSWRIWNKNFNGEDFLWSSEYDLTEGGWFFLSLSCYAITSCLLFFFFWLRNDEQAQAGWRGMVAWRPS